MPIFAVIVFIALIVVVPAYAESDLYKITFSPAEKATQESWFTAADAAGVSWVSGTGIGFDDDHALQGGHKEGGSYASADNAVRLTFPEALPAGQEYFIQASFYIPSKFNEGKSTIRGPGVVLNGNYSNTSYALPSSSWAAGIMAMNTWRTVTVNTPRMAEPLSSIEFRFFQQDQNAANNPDLWYIDNIVIKRGEWDLTLPSLAEVYKDSFLLGNITSPNQQDAATTAMFTKQYNVVTAENHMKPQYLSRSKGVYDFSGAEPIIAWAKENNLLLHGHTLVWHSQSANWLTNNTDKSPVTRNEARKNMEQYINEVAGYYAGKVISWDVVNEAFDGGSLPFDDWRDVLRKNSPWYIAYANGADPEKGETAGDYIYDAFVFARLADPNAILEYNDYNETDDWKREAMALMAEELNEKWKTDPRNTYPGRKLIEGLGMQSHHHTEHPEVKEIEASIQRFIEAGVRITVSELDVPVGRYNGPTSPVLTFAQEVEQAIYYARLFEYYKAYDAHITRVTFWGKADGQSWRGNYSPLLFDRALAPKQAFYAVLDPSGYLMQQGLAPRSLYDLAITVGSEGVVAGMPAGITVTATAAGLDAYRVVAHLDKNGDKYSDEIRLAGGAGAITLSEAPAAGEYRVVVNAYTGTTLFASKAVALTIDENPARH
ncbi:MAG TPA: endo-1,4-beta-xylanase [Acidobacteriota bacterium]|nr:endo-1,4-beta-xylanase [Acidobacteriota bacterium]